MPVTDRPTDTAPETAATRNPYMDMGSAKYAAKYRAKYGREPTDEELAAYTKKCKDKKEARKVEKAAAEVAVAAPPPPPPPPPPPAASRGSSKNDGKRKAASSAGRADGVGSCEWLAGQRRCRRRSFLLLLRSQPEQQGLRQAEALRGSCE